MIAVWHFLGSILTYVVLPFYTILWSFWLYGQQRFYNLLSIGIGKILQKIAHGLIRNILSDTFHIFCSYSNFCINSQNITPLRFLSETSSFIYYQLMDTAMSRWWTSKMSVLRHNAISRFCKIRIVWSIYKKLICHSCTHFPPTTLMIFYSSFTLHTSLRHNRTTLPRPVTKCENNFDNSLITEIKGFKHHCEAWNNHIKTMKKFPTPLII